MKRVITRNTKEIQGIITDYFESLYSNKLENLEEMYKFLHIFDHPKLDQEHINHVNRSITYNDIKATVKCLPPKEVQGLMDSPLNSTRLLKEN
jgi:hypothetical protein